MSKEVAGENEEVTLSECIADGRVPRPERMSFPKWQAWRKDEGRRPEKKRDGRGLTTEEEVALWRSIMLELYGEPESGEEEDEEEELLAEPEADAEVETALVPRPIGGLPGPGGRVGGSGGAPRLSGSPSPPPSSAGTGSAGVEELLRMLKAVFRPDEEEIGTYLSRITRLVMALKTLGHELASTEVDKLILKAEITQAVYEETGSWDDKAMVRSLISSRQLL